MPLPPDFDERAFWDNYYAHMPRLMPLQQRMLETDRVNRALLRSGLADIRERQSIQNQLRLIDMVDNFPQNAIDYARTIPSKVWDPKNSAAAQFREEEYARSFGPPSPFPQAGFVEENFPQVYRLYKNNALLSGD